MEWSGMGFSFLVTEDNYREIVPAPELAKPTGCAYIQFKPFITPSLEQIYAGKDREIRTHLDAAVEQAEDSVQVLDQFADRLASPGTGRRTTRTSLPSTRGSRWQPSRRTSRDTRRRRTQGSSLGWRGCDRPSVGAPCSQSAGVLPVGRQCATGKRMVSKLPRVVGRRAERAWEEMGRPRLELGTR
jgi:hypothetical protein